MTPELIYVTETIPLDTSNWAWSVAGSFGLLLGVILVSALFADVLPDKVVSANVVIGFISGLTAFGFVITGAIISTNIRHDLEQVVAQELQDIGYRDAFAVEVLNSDDVEIDGDGTTFTYSGENGLVECKLVGFEEGKYEVICND